MPPRTVSNDGELVISLPLNTMRPRLTIARRAAVAALLLAAPGAGAQEAPPERVSFPSADGRTTLTGYLFAPSAKRTPISLARVATW